MKKESRILKAVCPKELAALKILKDYLYEVEYERVCQCLVKQARHATSEYETYDEVYAQNLEYAKYAKSMGHTFKVCHWGDVLTVKHPRIRRKS